jgi:hypothetical protein
MVYEYTLGTDLIEFILKAIFPHSTYNINWDGFAIIM